MKLSCQVCGDWGADGFYVCEECEQVVCQDCCVFGELVVTLEGDVWLVEGNDKHVCKTCLDK